MNVVLFDGECNFCNNTINELIKRDKKEFLKFASLQSVYGQNLLKEHHLPTSDFTTFIYQRSDILYTRSSAAIFVIADLGGVWKLFLLFIVIPPFIRNFVYNFIAKNRHRLVKSSNACLLPTPELRKRFL